MNYPCLILKSYCTTDAHVVLKGCEIQEDGTLLTELDQSILCNYQDQSKIIITADKQSINVSGTALFPGDIAPNIAVISTGTVSINDFEREIAQGSKLRNPDGTVNHTRIDLR